MAEFSIKARITVSAEIVIEADSPEAARALFDEHLAMTVKLIDVDEDLWEVFEETVDEVSSVAVETA